MFLRTKVTVSNSRTERDVQHQYFMNSSLFWCVTQRRLAVNRRFGTTYKSHLQWSSSPRSHITTFRHMMVSWCRWFGMGDKLLYGRDLKAIQNRTYITIRIHHSLSSLSYRRPKASSKARSPQSFLL